MTTEQLLATLEKCHESLWKAGRALTWSTPTAGETCGGEVTIEESESWKDDAEDAIAEAFEAIEACRAAAKGGR